MLFEVIVKCLEQRPQTSFGWWDDDDGSGGGGGGGGSGGGGDDDDEHVVVLVLVVTVDHKTKFVSGWRDPRHGSVYRLITFPSTRSHVFSSSMDSTRKFIII